MRNTIKISYSVYIKNPKRPSAHYYARVREPNQPVYDVDLKTKSKAQAEAWVKLRRSEVEMVNAKILLGEPVSDEQMRSLVRHCNRYASDKPTKTATVREVLDEWERHLRRTGKRETTIATYLRAVKAIFSPVYPDPINTITETKIVDLLAQHDGLRSTSRKNYSVVAHEVMKYAVNKYDLNPKLVNAPPLVKVETVEKPYWKPWQVAKIIEAVKCKDKIREKVAKAYYWFLYCTGCRNTEAYNLLWTDLNHVDPVTVYVTVRAELTKTNKTRRIPLDWRIARMLSQLPREGSRIFASVPPSQSGRYSILAKAIKASGMPAGGLHTFRHSFCMLAYSKSEDIKAVSEIAGHSPEVGLAYYQSTRQQDRLRETMDKTFENENTLPSPIDELVKEGLW